MMAKPWHAFAACIGSLEENFFQFHLSTAFYLDTKHIIWKTKQSKANFG